MNSYIRRANIILFCNHMNQMSNKNPILKTNQISHKIREFKINFQILYNLI